MLDRPILGDVMSIRGVKRRTFSAALGPEAAWPLVASLTKEVAMRLWFALSLLLTLLLPVRSAEAQDRLERLYVIDCGQRTAPDVAPWTPGVNVGNLSILSIRVTCSSTVPTG